MAGPVAFVSRPARSNSAGICSLTPLGLSAFAIRPLPFLTVYEAEYSGIELEGSECRVKDLGRSPGITDSE